jgi:hypothetical protein
MHILQNKYVILEIGSQHILSDFGENSNGRFFLKSRERAKKSQVLSLPIEKKKTGCLYDFLHSELS